MTAASQKELKQLVAELAEAQREAFLAGFCSMYHDGQWVRADADLSSGDADNAYAAWLAAQKEHRR